MCLIGLSPIQTLSLFVNTAAQGVYPQFGRTKKPPQHRACGGGREADGAWRREHYLAKTIFAVWDLARAAAFL
jgi:hypothetical protein